MAKIVIMKVYTSRYSYFLFYNTIFYKALCFGTLCIHFLHFSIGYEHDIRIIFDIFCEFVHFSVHIFRQFLKYRQIVGLLFYVQKNVKCLDVFIKVTYVKALKIIDIRRPQLVNKTVVIGWLVTLVD